MCPQLYLICTKLGVGTAGAPTQYKFFCSGIVWHPLGSLGYFLWLADLLVGLFVVGLDRKTLNQFAPDLEEGVGHGPEMTDPLAFGTGQIQEFLYEKKKKRKITFPYSHFLPVSQKAVSGSCLEKPDTLIAFESMTLHNLVPVQILISIWQTMCGIIWPWQTHALHWVPVLLVFVSLWSRRQHCYGAAIVRRVKTQLGWASIPCIWMPQRGISREPTFLCVNSETSMVCLQFFGRLLRSQWE